MKLDSLKPTPGTKVNRKRVGRGQGSGTGKTSGRGHKGAGSRSGNKKRAWFEGGQMPLNRRLPKRGFSNYHFKREVQIVNLEMIAALGIEEVNPDVLCEKGLVRNTRTAVKVLANGELTKAVNVSANAFSKSAVEKIEKAGGKVTFL